MDLMGTVSTSLLTFEEFERLPDEPGKRELLEGELIELPPPEFLHSFIGERIYLLLIAALSAAHTRGEASELGRIHHEMGYRLSRNAYVIPDVSVTHARQALEKYLGGAPAIAIEVISPSNSAEAMETKTELYFRYGAREVWRFYPKTGYAVIHIPGSSRIEREAVRTPLLPGFELNIAEILAA